MSGLLKVIDMLGATIDELQRRIAQLEQELAVLTSAQKQPEEHE